MQGADVPLVIGPCDDLQIGAQFSTIDGEVHIGVVIPGGDDDGRSRFDAGSLQNLEFSGRTADVFSVVLHSHRVLLDDAVVDAAALKGARRGQADPAGSDDNHRLVGLVVDDQEPVVVGDLLCRGGEDKHRAIADHGLRPGGLEATPLPNADDAGSGHASQPRLGETLAHQGGPGGRGFGDEELVEFPEHVGKGVTAADATGQRLSEHLRKLEHPSASGELEDVDGCGRVGDGHDSHVLVHGTHGDGDVGVHLVAAGCGYQRRLVDAGACVSIGIVEIASDHAQTLVLQTYRLVKIGDDEDVAIMELLQPLDERAGQGVVLGNDDVVGDTRLQPARDARRVLGFDPGSPEELEEREGQQDEHEDRAGQQHEGREQATQVSVKGDVSKPQGGHHGEGPVDAGKPGVLLTFEGHERMEADAVGGHEEGEDDEKPDEEEEVPAPGSVRHVKRKEGGEESHHSVLRTFFAPANSTSRTAVVARW